MLKRDKNCIRILILAMLTTLMLCGIFTFVTQNRNEKPSISIVKMRKSPKKVHLSIDDATLIFQNISWNDYDSIFDNEILGNLQELHTDYGIKVTLYIFGELDEFAIWDFPLKYKAEFRANADWLQIGFHSGKDCDPQEDYANTEEFKEDYDRIESALYRLAGADSVTSVLRLHNWYATEEMMAYLREAGITAVLCRDSEEPCYDLTQEQVDLLYNSRDGVLEEDGIAYYATDVRLEGTENIVEVLEEHKNDRVIVVFTHAWCFQENRDNLNEAVRWLVENKYQFTDLKPSVKE